ncbi:MAG: ELWxxDGT repeat protein [Bacteroidota bacterium]
MKFLFTLIFSALVLTSSAQVITRVLESFGSGSTTQSDNTTVINGKMYFGGATSAGTEPWVSDGTFAGTFQLKNLSASGIGSSFPRSFTEFDGEIIFRADDGFTYGGEIYKTDGTTAGTDIYLDFRPGGSTGIVSYTNAPFIELNNKLIIGGDNGTNIDDQLYEYNPLTGTTSLIAQINPTGSCECQKFQKLNGGLTFVANNGTSGRELFFYDGFTAPSLLLDIQSGSGNSDPDYFTQASPNTLIFLADDGTNGEEPWITDGTPAGTFLLKDINPLGSSSANKFVRIGTKVYFFADDGTHGFELWETDGTEAGTQMVKDIRPGANGSAGFYNGAFLVASNILEYNGGIYFIANDGTHGYELWKSDGTNAGTQIVKDLNPGTGGGAQYIYGLTIADNKLWFSGDNGTSGLEVAASEGDASNTFLVWDVFPGMSSTLPRGFTALGSQIVFFGRNPSLGTWFLYGIELTTVSLPVEWLSFEADLQANGDVMLHWETANEQNNDYFQIEVSADGEEFEAIGREAGQGTTDQVISYSFLHRNPTDVQRFYRLKQVDIDGNFSLSQVIEVTPSSISPLRIYPQPAGDELTLQLPNTGDFQVEIFDLNGKQVYRSDISNEGKKITLPTLDWATGVYHLRMRQLDKRWSQTIIKQ